MTAIIRSYFGKNGIGMEKQLWFSKVWGALHVLYNTVCELSASPSNANYFGSSKMNFMSSHTKEQQDKRLPDI